jgi:hypothetical protein
LQTPLGQTHAQLLSQVANILPPFQTVVKVESRLAGKSACQRLHGNAATSSSRTRGAIAYFLSPASAG